MTAFTTNPLITAWRDNGYVVVTPDGVEIRDPDGKPFESRQLNAAVIRLGRLTAGKHICPRGHEYDSTVLRNGWIERRCKRCMALNTRNSRLRKALKSNG